MIATADRYGEAAPTTPDRLDKRKAAFVEAAHTLFLEQGYEHTTLADIVTMAGGSLATLYKLFGNKEGLLIAVVHGQTESGADIVAHAATSKLTPRQILFHIGQRLHERFLQKDMMALLRVVITRSMADPQFAREFHEKTMGKTLTELEHLFTRWQEGGQIPDHHSPDHQPCILAETLLALMVYDFQIATILHCERIMLDPARLDARIAIFCHGIGLEA